MGRFILFGAAAAALLSIPISALAQVAPGGATPVWAQYALLAWPLITALASLLYTRVDDTSKGHAVLSFLASLGLDLPKMLVTLRKVLSSGGSASGGGGTVTPIAGAKTSTPPPPAAKRERLGVLAPMAAGAIGLAGAVGIASLPATQAGCTPAQGAEVLSVLQEVATWGQTLLSAAQAIWPLIAARIPAASQATANADFANATASLGIALSGAQTDASTAVNGATITADIAAIQAAVAQVDAIYEQWSAGVDAGALGSEQGSTLIGVDRLHALATRIAAVRP